jgi:hypothetical protein
VHYSHGFHSLPAVLSQIRPCMKTVLICYYHCHASPPLIIPPFLAAWSFPVSHSMRLSSSPRAHLISFSHAMKTFLLHSFLPHFKFFILCLATFRGLSGSTIEETTSTSSCPKSYFQSCFCVIWHEMCFEGSLINLHCQVELVLTWRTWMQLKRNEFQSESWAFFDSGP